MRIDMFEMTKNKKILSLSMVMLLSASMLMAGNNERSGSAGASELLVNPWARSTGMGSAGSVMAEGLESMAMNIAGLARTRKLEVNFSHRDWLRNSGVDMNTFGLASHVGESGVVGFQIMSMSFGEITNTTVNNPEGGLGSFSPSFLVGSVAYAKSFSQRIRGGINFKVVHESITNLSASTIALDAGVNYTTGIDDHIKFGIALMNIGPAMTYSGTGLNVQGTIPGTDRPLTQQQRSQSFELPSLLNIGLAYDYLINKFEDTTGRGVRADHRITGAFTFTSNSFTPDLYRFGVEYAFREMFMGRLGYMIEGTTGDEGLGGNALTGLSLGATVEYPMNRKKNNGTIALDFSWQDTDNFGGITSIGVRLNL
jgi:hypothetical protein